MDTKTSEPVEREAGSTLVRRIARALPLPMAQWPIPNKRPLTLGRDHTCDIVLDDVEVSARHARILHRGPGADLRVEDLDSKNGTYLDGARIGGDVYLPPGGVLRLGRSIFVYEAIETKVSDLEERAFDRSLLRAQVESEVDEQAKTEAPVLVTGPTGAGKELLARRLHEQSRRRGDLVAINCAALNEAIAEAELFGSVTGAFTGAVNRLGCFGRADGGTLFLDEIGDLPLPVQAKLLRALEEKRILPVGSDRERPVDIRFVAATHVELSKRVESGSFRADLYHRLAGAEIRAPSLESRRLDVALLLGAFTKGPVDVSPTAMEALLTYAWPGNVRELRHLVERLASAGRRLEIGMLPDAMLPRPPPDTERRGRPDRTALDAHLRATNGNVSAVARALDVRAYQVRRWIDHYELDLSTYRKGPDA